MQIPIGTEVDFHPALFALHQARGIVMEHGVEERTGRKVSLVHATQGDGKGKSWWVYPEDIIRVYKARKD